MGLTDLSRKMQDIANTDSLPDDHPMRIAAETFDTAINTPEIDIKKLLGSWDKARRIYCEYTGEPLI